MTEATELSRLAAAGTLARRAVTPGLRAVPDDSATVALTRGLASASAGLLSDSR